MYLQNKYTRWYFKIITKAQSRAHPDIYSEIHHIIPRSLGGPDDKNNLVILTAKEHYVCHLLLTKMVTGKALYLMSYALWGMMNQRAQWQGRYKITCSRLYEYAKNLAANSLSKERKGKTLEELHGVEKALQIRANLPFRKKRSSPSKEERIKIGKAVSESWKTNTGPRGFQIKQPQKISCPCCGKTMDKGNYTKYGHGLNCRQAIEA